MPAQTPWAEPALRPDRCANELAARWVRGALEDHDLVRVLCVPLEAGDVQPRVRRRTEYEAFRSIQFIGAIALTPRAIDEWLRVELLGHRIEPEDLSAQSARVGLREVRNVEHAVRTGDYGLWMKLHAGRQRCSGRRKTTHQDAIRSELQELAGCNGLVHLRGGAEIGHIEEIVLKDHSPRHCRASLSEASTNASTRSPSGL